MLSVLLALIMAAPLFAGSPSGTLRDPHGRVLPGATVRLTAIGAEAVHETTSGPDGAFQFGEIPDGEYMFSARLPGFMSSRQRVRVTATMPALDITLPVGTLRETITIRGRVGETDSSSRGTTSARPQPPKPECGATEVGGNIKPPMKLKDVRPRYRQAVIDANVQGSVLLQAVIDVTGRVRNIEVVSPVNADLEEATIDAVSQWEFSPTWLNCEAIEVRMFVTASFEIER
jgi:TonB family protein